MTVGACASHFSNLPYDPSAVTLATVLRHDFTGGRSWWAHPRFTPAEKIEDLLDILESAQSSGAK
jgi:hypothetical protein